jgi:hypothetical protein
MLFYDKFDENPEKNLNDFIINDKFIYFLILHTFT